MLASVRSQSLFSCLLLLTLSAHVSVQAQQAQPAQREADLVLTGVTVVNPDGQPLRANMTVAIKGERIVSIEETREGPVASGTKVVDARGKFLIPGLWDMHTHTQNVAPELFTLPLFVAHGVLGVRDMGNQPALIRGWRERIASGSVLGPQIVAAGPFVDGPKPLFGGDATVTIANAEQGRALVSRLKGEGSDFIKLQSVVPRAAYVALAAEARRQNFPFVGHVPVEVSAREASQRGQKGIEHFTGVLLGCSREEAAIRRQLLARLEANNYADAAIAQTVLLSPPAQLLTSFDEKRCTALARLFRKNDTWHDPTFTMLRTMHVFEPQRALQTPRLPYVPKSMRSGWEAHFLTPRPGDEQARATAAAFFARYTELFRLLKREGNEFLAGTDVGYPYILPGFSLHDELAELVRAGMTPAEALRAATYNPARFLGLLAQFGTVEVGKVASLVLLDGNPLEDIAHTRKIASVILRGKLLSKADLAALLANAAAAAERH